MVQATDALVVLPGLLEVLLGGALGWPLGRRRHPALVAVATILVGVGFVDVLLEALRAQASPGRPVEFVTVAAIVFGTAGSAWFHALVLRRPVAPQRLQLVVAATWGVIAGLIVIEPFLLRPRWQLACATAALAAPWIATTTLTLLRLWRPRRRAPGIPTRQLLVVTSLGALALLLALKGVAFVVESAALLGATRVLVPAVVVVLFVGVAPPAWLRAALAARAVEHAGGGSLFVHAASPADLAARALRRALALTGARGGALLDDRGRVLAQHGIGDAELRAVQDAAGPPDAEDSGQPLGEDHMQALTIAVPMPEGVGRFVLAAGPLLPILSGYEIERVRELGLLVGTAMERFVAEERRRRERDEHDALLTAMDDIGLGMIRLRHWRVSYVNSSAAAMLDLRVDHLTTSVDGRSLVPPDVAAALSAFAVKVRWRGPVTRRTFTVANGRDERIVQLTVTSNGPLGDLVLLFDDVTQQVQAEERVARTNRSLERQARQREEQQVRLRRLYRELERARETERRRIALELHDDLGQLLTGLALRVAGITETHDRGDRAAARELIAELQQKVRDLALELRPGMLDRLGLAAALRWYAGHVRQSLELHVELELDIVDGQRLDPEVETHVFRIVQEALSNVARHAGTDRAQLVVRIVDDWLELQVTDWGSGFVDGPHRHTTGLSGIRERAAGIGGTATILSSPGEGTCVAVRLPVGEVTHDLLALDPPAAEVRPVDGDPGSGVDTDAPEVTA